MPPPPKPLLIYDGACHFCRHWVERWRRATGGRIDYAPWQEEASSRFPQIPVARFDQSIHFVEPGRISQGAEAVFRTLAYNPAYAWMLWLYLHAPGCAPVSEFIYSQIAAHRGKLGTVTRLLWGGQPEPPVYALTCALFLRCLGVVYCLAFLPLFFQIRGLLGDGGILPAAAMLREGSLLFGAQKYQLFPTLLWFAGGDGFMEALCLAGAGFAFCAALGYSHAVFLFAPWLFYLSLTAIGQDFFAFQWDSLLLETGFLALFLAPGGWRRRGVNEPSRIIFWLLRLLLFKLMFSSGLVKLASGDPTWRGLTALTYHYQTQPLPTWIGWHAHFLPASLHATCAALVFFIQLPTPFLIFAPRQPRFLCFCINAVFQLLIILTGNFGFFNYLSLTLCLLLLDDQRLRALLPARCFAIISGPQTADAGTPRKALAGGVALLILLLSFFQLSGLRASAAPPRALRPLLDWAESLRLVNSYGLFAVMTTSRREIVIEGSDDLQSWQEYELRWKPGGAEKKPEFIAPYHPRLDWQMWFAALGRYENQPWFARLLLRLLEGRTEVTGLFARNPFAGAPPRYIRAVIYDYRFATPEERSATGLWWQRGGVRPYSPILRLPGADS